MVYNDGGHDDPADEITLRRAHGYRPCPDAAV